MVNGNPKALHTLNTAKITISHITKQHIDISSAVTIKRLWIYKYGHMNLTTTIKETDHIYTTEIIKEF